MTRYLHSLSSFFFYALGLSFFAAYLLLRNDIWPQLSALWLQVADLPFALCAILYGGLSLYFSLRSPDRSSPLLGLLIGLPLVLLFGAIVAMNFWGMWSFSA
jgi:hypothetical protein